MKRKRIRLTARERLGQMRYLLRTRGPMSLQDLAKCMGYSNHGAVTGLLRRHGLPEGVVMQQVPSYGVNGGGGNWYRHIFKFESAQKLAA